MRHSSLPEVAHKEAADTGRISELSTIRFFVMHKSTMHKSTMHNIKMNCAEFFQARVRIFVAESYLHLL